MNRRIFPRGRLALVLASAFAVLSIGGIASAAIPSGDGTISGCVARLDGAVRVIDASITTCKSSKETPLNWSQQGPPGPQGLKGDPGAPATTLFALVRSDGSLVSGKGVVDAKRTSTGTYQVVFDRDISNCARQVSLEGFNGTAFGFAEIERFSSTGLFVGTLNTSATFADRGFNLAVYC